MFNYLSKLLKQEKYRQFFRYCVGGAIAFVVDFSLLYVLTEFLKVWYLWSATISFSLAAVVNYLIQRYWTFNSTDRRIARQFFIFLSVQTVGLFINNIIMYVAVEYFSLWYLFAKILSTGAVLIWNFGASKIFVFNEKSFSKRNDILIAANSCPFQFNETAYYIQRISDYLERVGHNVKIVCYSFKSSNKFKNDNEKPNTQFVNLVSRFDLARVNNRLPSLIKYLVFFIKLFNHALWVKVIYAQDPVASGLPAWLVARLLHKRIIVKISGDYAWEQAQLYSATRRNIDDWQREPSFSSLRGWINYKLRLINFIQRSVVRNADVVIVPSYYLKKILQLWGVAPNSIRVVYNSAEFNQIKKIDKLKAQAMIKIKGDIILTGGEILPWKGFTMLIELMGKLKKINPNFKLVIFGNGPYIKVLKQNIQYLGLQNNIFLTGHLSPNELYKYYSAAWLFVLNSCYESFIQNILNAMHYNLPIIVANRGSNPELIQDDYNGRLVEQNDKQEWLQTIEELWNKPNLRYRLTQHSLAKLDVFSFRHMALQTSKILFSI